MRDSRNKTQGVHHVGLTVPDLRLVREFFIDALGFTMTGERPDYPAAFVSDGHTMITLWQAVDPDCARPFNRQRNVGLHHLALATAQLASLHDELAQRDDVDIEFAPQPMGRSPALHMMCLIPGGIRLELVQV